MRSDMLDNSVHVKFTLLALVLLATARVCADEVTWIPGASSPAAWTIQPTNPSDGDMIHFSGPTRVYVNYCDAERALGGRPVLAVDVGKREIRLKFVPPAGEGCTTMSPICGLEGSFGQLAAGQWVFVCSQGGVSFSLPFTVVTDTSKSVYYVDLRARGLGTGLSWTDAFPNLQDALTTARRVCEIRVAKGIYLPDSGSELEPGDPDASFYLKKDVVLKGGYAGIGSPNPNQRDILVHETILSGDLFGNDNPSVIRQRLVGDPMRIDNCYHVVTAIGTDSTAVLDGFTIRGGYAFGSASPDEFCRGGGIRIE